MSRGFDPGLLPESPDLEFERGLWSAGVRCIAGIDEAGRGALAGPVAAAAVVLPCCGDVERTLRGVRDSKQMKPDERDRCYELVRSAATAAGVGYASPEEIDRYGIVPATRMAAERALGRLDIHPEHLLVDHLLLPDVATPQTALTRGDCRSLSIAAASVLAKVARDRVMRQMSRIFPGFDFEQHKGYGTRAHRQAIHHQGPTPIHRRTFRPVKNA